MGGARGGRDNAGAGCAELALPLVAVNVGGGIGGEGMEANWPDLAALLPPHLVRSGVFFLSETRLYDGTAISELRRGARDVASEHFIGMKYLAVCRPPPSSADAAHPATHDGAVTAAAGGLAVITFNRRVTMAIKCSEPLGAMAVELAVDGYDPLAVISVYNPPAGSPLNSGSAGVRVSSTLSRHGTPS